MKESYFREPVAHSEESIKQFRTIANNRIETLLRTRAPLDKLSTILGAEKFITVKKARSGASVIQFDIEGFVSDQIAKGTYLEIPTEYVETQEIILPPLPRLDSTRSPTPPPVPPPLSSSLPPVSRRPWRPGPWPAAPPHRP